MEKWGADYKASFGKAPSTQVTQDGDNVIICYTYPEKRLKE